MLFYSIPSMIMLSSSMMLNNPPKFVQKYLQRLKLNAADIVQRPLQPTIDNLLRIQESHLQCIPFENLSQHGGSRPATVRNINEVAVKVLDEQRGGFCVEVNALLAELLTQLGYTVCRTHAYVYGDNGIISEVTSHIVLIVSCPPITGEASSTSWLVDVGFGEPAIHPLRYDTWDEVQITPDGMQSKISKLNHGADDVVLYWWHASLNDWAPRLKWSYAASMLGSNGPPISDFDTELVTALAETSIFSRKMICCRLTREQKFTVAGKKFKITGSPRFVINTTPNIDETTGSTGTTPVIPVIERDIESDDDLRAILFEHFGIPIKATEGVAMTKSVPADPNVSNQ